MLYDAWDFVSVRHPKMVELLGWAELNKPGRKMEAIAAVERKLIASPDDPVAKDYRNVLYSQISEAEFVASIGPEGKPPKDFAYEYVEQLGLALVDNPDPEQRERGMDFLRIAVRGLPERGPGIFLKLAQVHEKLSDQENVRKCLESGKKVALAVGPSELARDQRQSYFDTLRKLADLADQRGDFEAAIEELRQYQTDGGTAALETYRKLAELYGKIHDAMNALLMTETGLTYNSTDPDLLEEERQFLLFRRARASGEGQRKGGEVVRCGLLRTKSHVGVECQGRWSRTARLGDAPHQTGQGDEAHQPRRSPHRSPGFASPR